MPAAKLGSKCLSARTMRPLRAGEASERQRKLQKPEGEGGVETYLAA